MSSNSSNDEFLFPVGKNMKLEELQKHAYYDVLHVFNAESSTNSRQKIMIMRDLLKELKISHKAHIEMNNKLKSDPLVNRLRQVTAVKEQKLTAVEGKPLTLGFNVSKEDIPKFKEKDIAPAKLQEQKEKPSWGQVSPESLVTKRVSIRMPGEDSYTSFLVNKYDAQTEMHHLVTARSLPDFVDPCDWVDLRQIPTEDITWLEGHPGFPTRKCFLKPGETILHSTSTAPQKKQEVGKTSSDNISDLKFPAQ